MIHRTGCATLLGVGLLAAALIFAGCAQEPTTPPADGQPAAAPGGGGSTGGVGGQPAIAQDGAAAAAASSETATGGAQALAITNEQLTAFAELALACIDRPFPYKPHHVLEGPESLALPSVLHPAFFGCFDWHSALHAHWMLLRLVKTHPDLPAAQRIRARLDRHLTREALAAEAEYFRHPGRKSFERPYGWAWLLRLAAEIRTWEGHQARGWAYNIRPLEQVIVERYEEYLGKLDWPIRTGVHPNTAFALAQAYDYAEAVGNDELRELIARRAKDYYAADTACPAAYEPGGEDFFSPCLLEADLMRRVLPAADYSTWLDAFLPGLRDGDLGPLGTPVRVSDPSDPKIAHLDGLNLVRAWCLGGIASALPPNDPRHATLAEAAALHTRTGLAGVLSGHYEGEHWLASFAVYLVTGVGVETQGEPRS